MTRIFSRCTCPCSTVFLKCSVCTRCMAITTIYLTDRTPGVIHQERPVFPAFQPRPLCPAVCFCESDCFGCFVEQNPTGSASCSLGSCTCERASKFLSTCPCRGRGLIPRGEIAGSCGHSMLNSLRALFCLLWHLHSQQQCPKGSGFGCHCSSLLLLSFLPVPDGGEVL